MKIVVSNRVFAVLACLLIGLPMPAAAVPQRIISLVPAWTESVCALQACERLVGVDRHSNWPMQVKKLPQLGGLDDVQLERIVALKPDLILVAPSARVVPRLHSLGLPVLVLDAQTQAAVKNNLQILAQRLGQEAQLTVVLQHLHTQMQRAAHSIPAAWRGAWVYVEIATTPFAAGPLSFIGETLQQLGLRNIIPAQLGAFPQINPEWIVRQQPQLIIAPQSAFINMAQRPGWHTLRALQEQHICGFSADDYDMLVRPGPRLGEAALKIAACLTKLPAPSQG